MEAVRLHLVTISIGAALAGTSTRASAEPAVYAESRAQHDDEDRRPSRVWILASAALGGGWYRLGPVDASAAIDAHVFLSDNVSLGVRGGVFATGAPDVRGAEGGFVVALGGARIALHTPEARPLAPDQWLHLCAGPGWASISGYDSNGAPRFRESTVAIAGRAAYVKEASFLALGVGLDVLGAPNVGVAIAPTFFAGLSF